MHFLNFSAVSTPAFLPVRSCILIVQFAEDPASDLVAGRTSGGLDLDVIEKICVHLLHFFAEILAHLSADRDIDMRTVPVIVDRQRFKIFSCCRLFGRIRCSELRIVGGLQLACEVCEVYSAVLLVDLCAGVAGVVEYEADSVLGDRCIQFKVEIAVEVAGVISDQLLFAQNECVVVVDRLDSLAEDLDIQRLDVISVDLIEFDRNRQLG